MLRKICVGFALFVVACNGGGGGGDAGIATAKESGGPLDCTDAGAGTSFPCDVAPIIESKCQRCHDQPDALATCLANNSCVQGPFPLLTWSDTRRPLYASRVIDFLPDAIAKKEMPDMEVMLDPPVEPLTDAEYKTMLAWARACAPAATTVCQ